MPRFHATAEGPVQFTPAEEAEWDAMAAAAAAAAPALQAEADRKATLDTAVSTDTQLNAFKSMSKAEFDTWWAANVTNAAQAIAVLKKLALLIIRRVL